MKTPLFWFKKKSILKYLLYPFTFIWKLGFFYKKNIYSSKNYPIPIICVGNIIMGGAGKTPLVKEISKIFNKQEKKVHIVYKAFNINLRKDVIQVMKKSFHKEVGDEPLLYSVFATVWIAKTRRKGIKKAIEKGADVILLDDGYQDYSIKKDLSLLVINSFQDFGNKFLFPSGPLRERIKSGIKKSDCIFYYGDEKQFKKLMLEYKKPVFFSNVEVCRKELKRFSNKKFIAFAGIAYPDNFFNTLSNNNINVIRKYYFEDHKIYKNYELEKIIKQSNIENSNIITTEKDYVKIPKKYKNYIDYLPISVVFDNKEFLRFINKRFYDL